VDGKNSLCLMVLLGGFLLASAKPAVAGPGSPRLVHLIFADGQTPLPGDEVCRGARVPSAHRCDLIDEATAEVCRQAIVARVEHWFRDFNVVFTFRPPATEHDRVVISSSGDWCHAPWGLAGDAPVTCAPVAATAFVYECTNSVERCAALIAHEEGHLLGLEHVDSPRDIMAEGGCSSCAGFEDRDNRVVAPSACGRQAQNGHRLLAERLGVLERAGGCAVGWGAEVARPPAGIVVLALAALGLRRRR
jgi:MYXO-CTERM domain-containing protein